MMRVQAPRLVPLGRGTMWWCIFVVLRLQSVEAGQKDTNTVYNPCSPLSAVSVGDAITIAVAINGDITAWYNNTDVRSDVLSPCGPPVADRLSSTGYVAIFRPQIDQLTSLNIENNSLISLSTTLLQSLNLVLYAQDRNKTIVTKPRSIMSPYGMVSSLTTIMEFDSGFLKNFTWKDDDCANCDAATISCLDNNCVSPNNLCTPDAASNNTCVFGINLAFSGTDKAKKTLQSWYQIANTEKFSLTAIYLKAKGDLTSGLNNIGNAVDGGTP